MRIWDVMFNEGSKILLRSSLSFLKMNEKSICQINDFGLLIHYMGDNVKNVYDEDSFMKGCFSFLKITWEKIHQLRKDCDVIIKDEIKKMEEKRKILREKMEEKNKNVESPKTVQNESLQTHQPQILHTPVPEENIEEKLMDKEKNRTFLTNDQKNLENSPRRDRRGTL